jgi:hypothetical protein
VPTTHPQCDAVICERLVCHNSKALLSTARRPYRAMANLRNIFRKIMAAAFFAELLAATHPPRKNRALPQEKLCAFSLPQDSHIELMFGAARFGEPASSASRSLGFQIAPRRRRSPQRLGTPHKCFNQQRVFDTTRRLAAPCGLNACSGAVFRKQRRA